MENMFSTDRKIIDLNAKDAFSIETFAQMQTLSDIDEQNKVAKNVTLMNLDDISRNRSLYDQRSFEEALTGSVYINESIKNGVWFGELEHPPIECSRERFLRVDRDNVSHRIMNYSIEGNKVIGDVKFIPPKGVPTVWEWISSGSNMAFSVRVLTPNYEEAKDASGVPYLRKFGQMQLVTFDAVAMPGFKNARIADHEKYDATKATEDFKGIHATWTNDRKKEEFVHLLKSQESLPILQDIYGFELNANDVISYSSEGFITIQANDTKSIKIPTNVMAVNRVLGIN